MTDASNVGGCGTLFQWQALGNEEFDSAISQRGTDGLNQDGILKHSYPDDEMGPGSPEPLELEIEPRQG